MVCLLAGGVVLSELGLAGPARPARAAAGGPRGHAVPDGDRAREPEAAPAVVLDRGRGPGRRPADREALLLPEAARRARAGDRVPPHDGAARALPPVGLPAGDQVPVRARAARARDRRRGRAVRLPGAAPRARGAAARVAGRTRRRGDRSRPAGRASSAGCAPSAPATIRATSTGARARAAGMPLVRENEDEEAREATVVLDNDPDAARRRGGVRARGLGGGGHLRRARAPRLQRRARGARRRGARRGRRRRRPSASCARWP